MGVIVSKFGGGSTANAAMLRRVASLLRADPSRRCAIVSAPGGVPKVTDLLAKCGEHRDRGQSVEAPLRAIERRFSAIATDLGLPDPSRAVRGAVLDGLEISADHVLSRGEALCANLLGQYVNWPMVDAAEVMRFGNDGALDLPASLALLRDAAEAHPRFILPGFYGADRLGRVHTLPRNGSDITGAVAAAALGAEIYENWTDVPGLMTADPSLVPDARPVPRVGYGQMARLAEAGARVLHPDCLSPVRDRAIPPRLLCTARPALPGTWVTPEDAAVVPCVAGRPLRAGEWPFPGDAKAPMALVTVFGADGGMKPRLVRSMKGGLVREDSDAHCFVTREADLVSDLNAAHHVLYPKA